jgi:hypothetical protein
MMVLTLMTLTNMNRNLYLYLVCFAIIVFSASVASFVWDKKLVPDISDIPVVSSDQELDSLQEVIYQRAMEVAVIKTSINMVMHEYYRGTKPSADFLLEAVKSENTIATEEDIRKVYKAIKKQEISLIDTIAPRQYIRTTVDENGFVKVVPQDQLK